MTMDRLFFILQVLCAMKHPFLQLRISAFIKPYFYETISDLPMNTQSFKAGESLFVNQNSGDVYNFKLYRYIYFSGTIGPSFFR
jgi:hypothetical protein